MKSAVVLIYLFEFWFNPNQIQFLSQQHTGCEIVFSKYIRKVSGISCKKLGELIVQEIKAQSKSK